MLNKILISTAIVILGIAGVFLVVQNSTPLHIQESQTNSQNNNFVSQNPLVQNAASEENLTELLAKQIGQRLVENNPMGPETIEDQEWLNVPEPENIAQDLLLEAAQKFNPESLKPDIKDGDLKISQDNSKEALANYILNFQKIVREAADKIPITLFSEELTLSGIIQLSDIYTETIGKFYKLTVPSSALQIHRKQIELLTVKRNIFEKIENYQEDSMTTILAVQELEKNDSEFNSLSEMLKNFIQKNNLNS